MLTDFPCLRKIFAYKETKIMSSFGYYIMRNFVFLHRSPNIVRIVNCRKLILLHM